MTSTVVPDAHKLTDHLFTGLRSNGDSRVALVPGDPDRVNVIAEQLDDAEIFNFRRGYRGTSGIYRGVRVFALSSGIGGPSLERVIVELRNLGVDTVIRVGTTGAVQPEIAPGDLIVNEAAVRLDGTSSQFARPEFPAAASWQVVRALVEAADQTGRATHVGVGATMSSFFAGQGRETFSGWSRPDTRIVEELRHAGVLNFEMETATLLTVGRLIGLRVGAICAVVNNRLHGLMGGKDAIPVACRVALDAAATLAATPVSRQVHDA